MAKNFVQDGAVMDVTLSGTKAAGDLVMVTDVAAVLLQGGVSTNVVQGQIEGVFTLPKAAPLVIAQGAILYWNGTALTNTSASGANPKVGIAFRAGASADTTIQCKLNV